jgi:hypothetical protein
MNQNLPEEWDEERIRRIIAYYDRHPNREVMPRKFKKRSSFVFVEIPRALLPDVLRLVSDHEEKQAQRRTS